jgi:hypothetical protein
LRLQEATFMLLPVLRIAAAKDALGVATAESLINMADHLLNQGIYSYSLGRLGTFPNPTACSITEVRPLFAAVLKEFGVPAPSIESAMRVLLRSHLEAIVEGARVPAEGMRRLYAECHANLFQQDRFSQAVFDSCGCRPLMSLCWDYDILFATEEEMGYYDYREERARAAAFDARVLETGTRWLRQYGLPELDRSYLDSNGGAARQLARTVHETQAFADLPVLADALEEAGCSEPELLEHFRYPQGHVSCCWLVEWLLDVQ